MFCGWFSFRGRINSYDYRTDADVMKNKNELKENKIKAYVMEYIHENSLVKTIDNVVFVPKAFKCNGIIRWCIRKRSQRLITDAGIEKHYKAMDRFIKGEIDLVWNPKGYVEVKRLQ